MKVLAIDASLNETGYWLSNETNGVIKPRKDLSKFDKIIFVQALVKSLIKEHGVEIVALEGYSYGSRNTSFTFTAGELGGCIKMVCYDAGIDLVSIPPTVVKKFVCGKGNVKKEQMLLQLYKKYGVEFSNNNIADAYAIHTFYLNFLSWCKVGKNYLKKDEVKKLVEAPKYEVECFKSFKKMLGDEK